MDCVRLSKVAVMFGVSEQADHKTFLQYGNNDGFYLMAMDSNGAMWVRNDIVEELHSTDKYLNSLIYEYDDVIKNETTDVPQDTEPRVYFLVDSGTIAYIGKSKNFKSRLLHHKSCKVFTGIATFVTERDKLSITEEMNILHYKPSFNLAVIHPEAYFRRVVRNSVFE